MKSSRKIGTVPNRLAPSLSGPLALSYGTAVSDAHRSRVIVSVTLWDAGTLNSLDRYPCLDMADMVALGPRPAYCRSMSRMRD
jgi:hypothetical protein